MSRQAPPPLDDFHWALRTEVYRHFGATTHAPTLDALAAWSSRRSAEVLEALEALGIPAILGVDGWTEARCAATGTPLGYGVKNGRRVGDDGVIHLVVPPRRALVRGGIMTLYQCWVLSSGWYAGRMGAAWRGRTAEASQAILESAGLTGPCWKLT